METVLRTSINNSLPDGFLVCSPGEDTATRTEYEQPARGKTIATGIHIALLSCANTETREEEPRFVAFDPSRRAMVEVAEAAKARRYRIVLVGNRKRARAPKSQGTCPGAFHEIAHFPPLLLVPFVCLLLFRVRILKVDYCLLLFLCYPI